MAENINNNTQSEKKPVKRSQNISKVIKVNKAMNLSVLVNRR